MSIGVKLLLVDDEQHIRLLYRQELEAAGYELATSDGQEDILQVISRERPQVVILDIKLGLGRSGLDLLQDIKSMNERLPVILHTAYDSFQYDTKCIPADYYVVKSVDISKLKDKIALAITKAGS